MIPELPLNYPEHIAPIIEWMSFEDSMEEDYK